MGLSTSVISRVIIGSTPFRVLLTLLMTYLLPPLGLQVEGFALKGGSGWGRTLALGSDGSTTATVCSTVLP